VLDPVCLSVIPETGGQALAQLQTLIDLPQQQTTGVGGNVSAVELRYHLTLVQVVKTEPGLATLCHSRSRFLSGRNIFLSICLCQKTRLSATSLVRFPG
jgi:hypothetical protein